MDAKKSLYRPFHGSVIEEKIKAPFFLTKTDAFVILFGKSSVHPCAESYSLPYYSRPFCQGFFTRLRAESFTG
jgi:hypothetical protein